MLSLPRGNLGCGKIRLQDVAGADEYFPPAQPFAIPGPIDLHDSRAQSALERDYLIHSWAPVMRPSFHWWRASTTHVAIVTKHTMPIKHWVFLFVETFRSLARNSLKVSVILSFSVVYNGWKRHHDPIDLSFFRWFKKIFGQLPKKKTSSTPW